MIVDSFYTQQEISFSHAALFVCTWVAYLFDKWLLCKCTAKRNAALHRSEKQHQEAIFNSLSDGSKNFFALSKKFATQMLSPIEILP
jgi:hypothetical protein